MKLKLTLTLSKIFGHSDGLLNWLEVKTTLMSLNVALVGS